jgi:hypothetical protein
VAELDSVPSPSTTSRVPRARASSRDWGADAALPIHGRIARDGVTTNEPPIAILLSAVKRAAFTGSDRTADR